MKILVIMKRFGANKDMVMEDFGRQIRLFENLVKRHKVDFFCPPWLLIATFLIALFLALAKRREELTSLEDQSNDHRPVLTQYTTALTDELISVVTPVTLLAYLMYTLDAETKLRFQSDWLYVTGIFVIFGVFRYLYLIHRKNLGGSPTDLVLKDIPLLGAVVGWGFSFVLIIYL